jgi:hypothetical protein
LQVPKTVFVYKERLHIPQRIFATYVCHFQAC